MAIITFSGGIASASGSLGGTTFSRNRGGPYMRTRAIPVNPGTSFQSTVRQILADLTSRWAESLTQAERDLWDTYALNVPMPNALGEPRNVGGIGMYVRSNVPRTQAGLDRVDAAPTIFNLGEFTAPSLASATAPTALSVTFQPEDNWAEEDGSAMLIYGSRGTNPGINFFKGPYRYADKIEGDAVTPPATPAAIVNPFPFVATQRVFVRAIITRADGRLSSSFRFGDVAV